MRYSLARVVTLFVVIVGAGRLNAGVVRPGMNQEEVDQAIGAAALCVAVSSEGSFGKPYVVSDCVGGQMRVFVDFGRDGLVVSCDAYYEPFAVQPAWLTRLRDAFSPATK